MENKEKLKYLIAQGSFNLGTTSPELKNIIVADGPCGLRQNSKKYPNGNPGICLPCVNNIACSFSKDVAYSIGNVLASQCIKNDVDIILAPGVNIKRNLLCGRNFEYFSEDPYLSGTLGTKYVLGVQDLGVGTSLKHFCLNNSEYDRTSQSSNASTRTIREIYTKSFEMIIKDANPWTLMCSYNPVNGTNMAENKDMLKGILRDKFNYQNVIVSDWGAVHDRNEALKATLDVQFPHDDYHEKKFMKDYEEGKVDHKLVDESFNRVAALSLKIKENKAKRKALSNKKIENACIDAICQSTVLLKNEDNILPLKSGSVLVLGDANNNPYYRGGGSAEVISSLKFPKLSDKLKEENNNLDVSKYDLYYAFDCLNTYGTTRIFEIKKGLEMASKVDKIIFLAGNDKIVESEGSNRESIKLNRYVEDLIKKFAKVNKNIVVVLETGGVIDCSGFVNDVKGLVQAGFGGTYINHGLAKVLVGNVSPSGRLSETYPYSLNDTVCKDTILDGYNDNYDEGVFVGYRHYQHNKIDVLFPFGYGLSYASFSYSNKSIKKLDNYNYEVSIRIHNDSDIDAYDVIELFVANPKENPVERPVKELRRLEKIKVKANSSKLVKFNLSKDCFEYFNEEKDCFDVNPGTYEIQLSKNANEVIKGFKVEIR